MIKNGQFLFPSVFQWNVELIELHRKTPKSTWIDMFWQS